MSNFVSDLQYGEEAERLCMEYLARQDAAAEFVCNEKKKEYDFVHKDSSGISRTYEVKRDRMAPRTGNVAIEMKYKGLPSGLTVTTSDFIVYMIGERLFRITPKELREAVIEDRAGRFVYGGDNNDSLLWLMKVDVFTSAAEELI